MKKPAKTLLALELEIAFVNRTPYLLGKTSLCCARQTFLHPILSDTDDDAPEFTCLEHCPSAVKHCPNLLTDDLDPRDLFTATRKQTSSRHLDLDSRRLDGFLSWRFN